MKFISIYNGLLSVISVVKKYDNRMKVINDITVAPKMRKLDERYSGNKK